MVQFFWPTLYIKIFTGHVIILMSGVHRTQSVSAVFCPFFHHLPLLNTTASYELMSTRKMNMSCNETCLNVRHQCSISTYYANLFTHTCHHQCLLHKRKRCWLLSKPVMNSWLHLHIWHKFLPTQQTFYTNHVWLLGVKRLSPSAGCISEWMPFG